MQIKISSKKKTEQNGLENGTTVEPEKGISVWATGLLLTGELAGAGMVALPQAIQYLGWLPGLISLLLIALIAGYTGTLLGTCWYTLQQRWPEYKTHCKRPFQEIGRRAVGKWMTYIISLTIDFTLFGTCVACLILASQNIHSLLTRWFDLNVSFCLVLIVITVCLVPLTFLGSPKDFWQAVVLAMGCTTVAAISMIVGMALDNSQSSGLNGTDQHNASILNQNATSNENAHLSSIDKLNRFFLAFGVVLFAYTGHSVFPVVQQDMKKPKKWSWAVIIAFSLQLVYYVPISMLGYHVYGADLKDNVMMNLDNIWCRSISSLLITFHVMLSFVPLLNPISQELEHLFKVENKFCWKRAVVRTIVVVAILFVAESIPNFGVLLSLFGGTGNALLALIYPPIFYYFLVTQESDQEMVTYFTATENKVQPVTVSSDAVPKKGVPWYTCIILLIIIVIGIIMVFGNGYSSLKTIIYPPPGDAFKPPCYMSLGQ